LIADTEDAINWSDRLIKLFTILCLSAFERWHYWPAV